MAINFTNIDSSKELKGSRRLKRWIKKSIEQENRIVGEIAIAFCSDSYIKEQNNTYLSHNYFTDILTFSYNEDEIISGDLLISTDTVKSNAELFETSYQNELHRVIIHGVLHLLGYNDITEAEKKEMRQKENFYINELDKI